jgi:hypothetical protein
MGGPFQLHIYCDKSNASFGARVEHVEKVIREMYTNFVKSLSKKESASFPNLGKFRILDLREGHFQADINLHLDFPVLSAVPWANVNVCVRRLGDNQWCDAYEKNTLYKGIDQVVSETDLSSAELCDSVFISVFRNALERRPKSGVIHCPPVIAVEDCPSISIITPTYNRRAMIDIAFHNLLSTDYPHSKIEWVVVEDAERTDDMISDKIINFQMNAKEITVKYIPIQGRLTIGEKRNIGIEKSSHDIILFMDDDDHYPVTSIRRRVSWLVKGRRGGEEGSECTVCTQIALYDLKRGVSAVNVPPWNLQFAQRISEATLTFKKSFWESRKFSHVSMAEGEEWISGRENDVLEMPPQQIIVAFTHDKNASSRRIPPVDAKVSCFWGFPKEYLIFIHKLAGVEIVEDNAKKSSK